MSIVTNQTTELIGKTPIYQLPNTNIYVKLEKYNVGGSVKAVSYTHLVGYVHYAENASKFTRTVAKVGGPVLIGYLLYDMQNDYQMYSGRELAKAWGADLLPVVFGLGGGVAGSAGGPAGSFVVGVTLATTGDYYKDKIKSNLKKDVVK